MNFIELCRAAASDSGTIAGLPSLTSVVGATGRGAQLVGWVRDAWIDIQNERSDWIFMRSDSLYTSLTPGKAWYTPVELGIPNVARMLRVSVVDLTRGISDTSDLRQIPYSQYRTSYGLTEDLGRPVVWSEYQDNLGLLFGAAPVPDKAYQISGDYILTPQVLENDTDIPRMPAQYHRLIQAEAIRLAARSDEAFQVLGERADMYTRLRYALVRDMTPVPSIANEYIG